MAMGTLIVRHMAHPAQGDMVVGHRHFTLLGSARILTLCECAYAEELIFRLSWGSVR